MHEVPMQKEGVSFWLERSIQQRPKALVIKTTRQGVLENRTLKMLIAQPVAQMSGTKRNVGLYFTRYQAEVSQAWRMVGSLNMTDPTQHCPDSWQNFISPRSCGKKTTAPCDSLSIPTFGVNYQKVCGWFRGYQFGSPDAFDIYNRVGRVEDGYVDGVSITYGSPGRRQHVYTYASGAFEQLRDIQGICPCQGGTSAPSFVGSDYYCESGNPDTGWRSEWYSSDVLWDGLQCTGIERTCCNRTDLPWFCKTFSTPISEDLEVRICTDEGLDNENVVIESFELYIQVQYQPARQPMPFGIPST
eukprot:Em0004g1745a